MHDNVSFLFTKVLSDLTELAYLNLVTLIHQIKGGLYLTGLKLKRGLINVLQGKKVFKETLINVQTSINEIFINSRYLIYCKKRTTFPGHLCSKLSFIKFSSRETNPDHLKKYICRFWKSYLEKEICQLHCVN